MNIEEYHVQMSHPCPKCERLSVQNGETIVNGIIHRVYQCDKCVTCWDFGGEMFEAELTFAVSPDGSIIDLNPPSNPFQF